MEPFFNNNRRYEIPDFISFIQQQQKLENWLPIDSPETFLTIGTVV